MSHSWRYRLPLMLGITAGSLMFVYLVLPGFVIGLMIAMGFLDPPPNPKSKIIVRTIFSLPVFLADNVKPIGNFYEWQIRVTSGYR